MPGFRELTAEDLRRLPGRELSGRDKRKLARYRSYIRDMMNSTNGKQAALELSEAENKRAETVKRWLRRAAREEGICINVKKRGEFLIFEATE